MKRLKMWLIGKSPRTVHLRVQESVWAVLRDRRPGVSIVDALEEAIERSGYDIEQIRRFPNSYTFADKSPYELVAANQERVASLVKTLRALRAGKNVRWTGFAYRNGGTNFVLDIPRLR